MCGTIRRIYDTGSIRIDRQFTLALFDLFLFLYLTDGLQLPNVDVLTVIATEIGQILNQIVDNIMLI